MGRLAIIVLLLLFAAEGAEAVRRAPCSPPGARTMAQNAELRVYQRAGHVVACDRGTGRRMWLGRSQTEEDDDYVRVARLGGRFVAIVVTSPSPRGSVGGPDRIALADFDRRRFEDLKTYGCEFLSPDLHATITSVVVSPRGRMAWLCETQDASNARTFELRGFGSSGQVLLDTGRLPQDGSEGSGLAWPWFERPRDSVPTLRWIHGRAVRAARLG